MMVVGEAVLWLFGCPVKQIDDHAPPKRLPTNSLATRGRPSNHMPSGLTVELCRWPVPFRRLLAG